MSEAQGLIPTWAEVGDDWLKMAGLAAHEFGCIFRVERSPYGWGCSIYDPAYQQGVGAGGKATLDDAVKGAVKKWGELVASKVGPI